MKHNLKKTCLTASLAFSTLLGFQQVNAQEYNVQVDTKKVGSPIQKTMYGIFFEDINFGADGGLYAELVKNRSFEFDHNLVGWLPFGNVKVMNTNPCFDKNPNYVQISYDKELTGSGLENEGFAKGMGIKADETYKFSVYARCVEAPVKLRVQLVNSHSDIMASTEVEFSGKEWKKYSVELKSRSTDAHSKLRLTLVNKGVVDLDHISLFPSKTFKGRENGMREDLAQALADLHPGIFRFPGGCIVEGTNLATRYQWKNTIGAVENRPTNINRWNYTFGDKKYFDYYQSYGLGFYEYFQLSEDIGAEPLPVLSCGLSCQFENHDPNENCAVDKLQPFIQDALDLIEFANGPSTSKWGKVRTDMGHPAPFNLKFIAIGNEQWGPLYPERLEPFLKAIRAKYPNINVIGTAGPSPDGKDFDFGWKEMKRLKADLVDEHYYKDPQWFLDNAKRYDNYDRKAPKVFAGEYACHPKNKKNDFEGALCESAFMTGFERNADVVKMCTYAPLFAHVDAWQWRPDLIWFDNLKSVKSVNYYVQQLYGMNVGTNVLTTTYNNGPLAGQDGLYASTALDKNKMEIIVKIANTSKEVRKVKFTLNGLKAAERKGTHTILTSDNIDAENTLDKPNTVVPATKEISVSGNALQVELAPQSFNLYTIKL
ncbi:alpha-L-arabinofuranosidase C-terminal domain-containing protein [Parabacteroides sp. FAFU027]|uniref:alpha-L-arabinofuranosidase C-terminal domain-containing protein n=1 Tax=Parabacteroides sp. FAFU027 TaxID=2922715 RepID=UPI001FAF8454|nr:alpha-L-arabinofuranosidase C-terminal domain-containing protein [Parabacteroides sp. FAFU027]